MTESASAGGDKLPPVIRGPVRFADEEEDETTHVSAPAGGIETDGSSDSGTSDNPDNPETTDPDVGMLMENEKSPDSEGLISIFIPEGEDLDEIDAPEALEASDVVADAPRERSCCC